MHQIYYKQVVEWFVKINSKHTERGGDPNKVKTLSAEYRRGEQNSVRVHLLSASSALNTPPVLLAAGLSAPAGSRCPQAMTDNGSIAQVRLPLAQLATNSSEFLRASWMADNLEPE